MSASTLYRRYRPLVPAPLRARLVPLQVALLRVLVSREGRGMDGKRIRGILLLAAPHGATLTIAAEGPDEAEALAALKDLVASGFGEDTWSA